MQVSFGHADILTLDWKLDPTAEYWNEFTIFHNVKNKQVNMGQSI